MCKRVVFLCVSLLAAGSVFAQDDGYWERMFDVHKRFAEAGSTEGEFKLAQMYEEGRGTAVNLAEALKWYKKAASQGHKEAQRRVDNWKARQAERARKAHEAELARQRVEQDRIRQAGLARKKEQEAARQKALAEQKRAQRERRRLEAQKRAEEQRRQEARRRAEQKVRQEERARAAQEKARRATQKPVEPSRAKVSHEKPANEPPQQKAGDFEIDPCKTPAARFMSTCR